MGHRNRICTSAGGTILIQLPSVQNFAKDKIVSYLNEK
jgi:hypothetical protein